MESPLRQRAFTRGGLLHWDPRNPTERVMLWTLHTLWTHKPQSSKSPNRASHVLWWWRKINSMGQSRAQRNPGELLENNKCLSPRSGHQLSVLKFSGLSRRQLLLCMRGSGPPSTWRCLRTGESGFTFQLCHFLALPYSSPVTSPLSEPWFLLFAKGDNNSCPTVLLEGLKKTIYTSSWDSDVTKTSPS